MPEYCSTSLKMVLLERQTLLKCDAINLCYLEWNVNEMWNHNIEMDQREIVSGFNKDIIQ
jgi:hypothetical protein